MGQQVRNLLRAQSKYDLMESSAKTGKKFSTGHRSSFSIKLSFGIGHPHLYIKCSVYMWGRAQGSQIFKRNSIISIRSKVMAFLVILLSPSSPHCPHRPHHPHIVPIAPRRSPCGPHCPRCPCCPHPCCLHPCCPHPCCPHPCCPRRPRHPHIIPTSSRRSPDHSQPPR